MNFEEYLNTVRNEVLDVRSNAFKNPFIAPFADIFTDIIEYEQKSVGKLLRPTLCVLVSDALKGHHEEAVQLGASIELAHAGSLVHDDYIDEDETRRGQVSVWKKFGSKSAVLFGDLLFVASASQTRTLPIESHRFNAFHEVMDIYQRASSGAMREIKREPFNTQQYVDIIRLKTAAMYRGAARMGCITANATDDITNILSHWAEDVGTAFQIEDDIADIRHSIATNTPTGDVREGKVTLPVLILLVRYPKLMPQCMIYKSGVENMDQIGGLTAMFPEGVHMSQTYVNEMLNRANQQLDLIPFSSEYKDMLKEYATYLVESMRKE